MLPNHAPLVVAERFKTLEALFPGRIDLGLGRAPGTDQLTALALRRLQEPRGGDDFLERLQELIFWDRGLPRGPPVPARSRRCPPTRRCRRSGCSARATMAAGSRRRSASASPSRTTSPRSTRSRSCGCTATATIATVSRPSLTRSSPSRWFAPTPMPRPSASPRAWTSTGFAARTANTRRCRARRRRRRTPTPPPIARASPGTAPACSSAPRRPSGKLSAIVAATGADEVMVTSAIYDHAARKRSYELLAKEFGLAVSG